VIGISELLCFLPFYDCLTRENGLPCMKHPVTKKDALLERMHSVFNIML
jgi:hypothetical protein